MQILKDNLGFLAIIILFFIFTTLGGIGAQSVGKTKREESYYQEQIQKITGGKREVILNDGTRVDILTQKDAIEVEFAHKWYEAVGQSLWYAHKTHKNPVIWLIVESSDDMKYVNRCKELCNNIYLDVALIESDTQLIQRVRITVNVYNPTADVQ